MTTHRRKAQLATTQLVDENDPWPGLEEWLNWSDAKRVRIARRVERDPAFDPWDALDAHESDRSLLVWAFKTTPAPNLPALRLKARALQVPRGTPGCLASREGRELSEVIVRDLLTMEKAA